MSDEAKHTMPVVSAWRSQPEEVKECCDGAYFGSMRPFGGLRVLLRWSGELAGVEGSGDGVPAATWALPEVEF